MRSALTSEVNVARWFSNRGPVLLFHRQKFCGIEIDLIFYDREGCIVFVEVKSYTLESLTGFRLGKNQLARLINAKSFFESIYAMPVEIRLALEKQGTVQDFIVG